MIPCTRALPQVASLKAYMEQVDKALSSNQEKIGGAMGGAGGEEGGEGRGVVQGARLLQFHSEAFQQ